MRNDTAAATLARHVVCNAHEYIRVPSVLTDNWIRLKEAQGHPITTDRMDRLDVFPKPAQSPLARDIADRAPRISQRIAAHLDHLKNA